jgi:hypothetical protein
VSEVRDSSGQNNHGQAYGGALITNDARLVRAGWFDGTNDYVQFTNTASLQVDGNLTLSFWIKPTNLGTGRKNPLDKSYGGEFALTIETNRALNFYQGSQRASGKYIGWTALPAGALTNGAWHHIVITRDAATRTLRSYLNGIPIGSYTYANDTNTLPAKSTYPVRLALGYTGSALGGVLDEIKIATNVWTANQVDNEYRVGLAGLKALRAWRIGNSDNIMVYNSMVTNGTVSADIRYLKQDPYFNDAELYLRYQNRDNFVKVGIRNFYGFWRLKYTVRQNTNIVDQGWICDFPKTNRPVEGAWYNLRVDCAGPTNKVYFNGKYMGMFLTPQFASGKVGVGCSAQQMGIWEPQKGYYFIDDDEYSFWAPEGQPQLSGRPMNLDWGYLKGFFGTLILPSVYVMSDLEVTNIYKWITNGTFSLLATDGSVAKYDPSGAVKLGRIEKLFGVGSSVNTISNMVGVMLNSTEHYVKLDYAPGTVLSASGVANPWTTLSGGTALATVSNAAGGAANALIVNTYKINTNAPAKVICFNYGVDTGGQLTNALKMIARRAFEWARGNAFKVKVELKYKVPQNDPNLDLVLYTTNAWVLGGFGATNITVKLPSDGIMTGDKLYWSFYVYPWDATDPWLAHSGFYSQGNDGTNTSLAGKGIQILGATDKAYAGRDWDMWVAYNTRTQVVTAVFGIRDKGSTQYEDNFNDGDYNGWSVVASPRIQWSVVNGALQAKVTNTASGGYGYIYWNGLNITGKNITIEYDLLYTNNARAGGLIYGGRVLYVNPNLCGWADNTPNYYTNNRPVPNQRQKIAVHIRDGSPYLMSDLYVDGKAVFVSEPIEVTTWSTNTIGFLSPYSNLNAAVQWDNVRVADEQYSMVYTNIMGERVPTSSVDVTFWPSVPDYDPDWWEHDGTTYGAQYQWYVYLRGEGVHSYQDTKVYFAPRLRAEATNFPTYLVPGSNVVVPVEWDQLPTNDVRLLVRLWEAWSGTIYTQRVVTISTNAAGSTNVPITLPSVMPAGSSYVWTAFMYPASATDPWLQRIGCDDTFRIGPDGIGIEPETVIRVPYLTSNGVFTAYSDAGIPPGSQVFVWQGGTAYFNGDYTGITPPEGTKCFMTTGTSYQGWGVFLSTNMSAYSNGYLKFWVRSSQQLKVDLEGPQYTKSTVYIASTTNTWKEFSLPISSFSGVNLSQMYGLFEVTAESPGTFYIDYVRWSKTP